MSSTNGTDGDSSNISATKQARLDRLAQMKSKINQSVKLNTFDMKAEHNMITSHAQGSRIRRGIIETEHGFVTDTRDFIANEGIVDENKENDSESENDQNDNNDNDKNNNDNSNSNSNNNTDTNNNDKSSKSSPLPSSQPSSQPSSSSQSSSKPSSKTLHQQIKGISTATNNIIPDDFLYNINNSLDHDEYTSQHNRKKYRSNTNHNIFSGAGVHSDEAKLYVYEKKVARLNASRQLLEKEQDQYNDDDTVNQDNQGHNDNNTPLGTYTSAIPNESGIAQIAQEIKNQQTGPSKHVRRKRYHIGDTIDYVNTDNQLFNQKVDKDYKKVTQVIKSRLERGSAE